MVGNRWERIGSTLMHFNARTAVHMSELYHDIASRSMYKYVRDMAFVQKREKMSNKPFRFV